MKLGSTLFLRLVIFLIGAAVLAFCLLVLPQTIGSVAMWGYDPILIGMSLTSIPFFIALYQGLKILNYIDTNKAFSESSAQALKVIKNCAAAIGIFYAVSLPYIFYVAEKDDAPGVALLGLIFTFAPLVVAVGAAVLQRLFQNAIDLKSENSLTV